MNGAPWRAWLLASAVALSMVSGCDWGEERTPLERAQALLKEGQWEAAVSAADKAIAANPKDAAAFVCRGKACVQTTHLDQAIDDFTAAIQLAPQDAENYYQRAIAYKELGYIKQSVADERQARKLDPSYAQAYLHTPEVYGSLPISSRNKVDSNKVAGKRYDTGDMPLDLPSVEELLSPDYDAEALMKPDEEEPSKVVGADEHKPARTQTKRDPFRQNPQSMESQRKTTAKDAHGQPLVMQSRTATEEVLGIDLPNPDDPIEESTPRRSAPVGEDTSGAQPQARQIARPKTRRKCPGQVLLRPARRSARPRKAFRPIVPAATRGGRRHTFLPRCRSNPRTSARTSARPVCSKPTSTRGGRSATHIPAPRTQILRRRENSIPLTTLRCRPAGGVPFPAIPIRGRIAPDRWNRPA